MDKAKDLKTHLKPNPGISFVLSVPPVEHGIKTSFTLRGSLRPSNVSHIPILSEKQHEELTNVARLHLLQDSEIQNEQKLPKWMRHYHLACYCFYALGAVFSLFYLIVVGIYQADPMMQIQYQDIVSYLECNSYSILSPLLCPVFMMTLAYHVRKKILLDEGDFFGILGILLLFALINFHDGHAVVGLGTNSNKDQKSESPKSTDPPPVDLNSRQEFHWQYAWSTNHACAKKYVRNLMYSRLDRSHLNREIVVAAPVGRELSDNASANVTEAPTPSRKQDCDIDKYDDRIENASIRTWMRDLQNIHKCCGPYGYLDWQMKFQNKSRTGCKEEWITDKDKGEIPDCYAPLMRWLDKICYNTFCIMTVQGSIYIICMVLVLIHHTAMKLQKEVVAKQYSLLNLADVMEGEDPWWRETRPSDQPQIVGHYNVNELGRDDDTDDEGHRKREKGREDASLKSTTSGRRKRQHYTHIKGKMVAIDSNASIKTYQPRK